MSVIGKKETRKKALLGAKLLHDAVASTMGPKGRDVLIRNKVGQVVVTHDGITVAKAVYHDDKAVQNGIDLLRDGGKGMNNDEDGSTTVVVLAYALITHLNRKKNPMKLRDELDALVPIITQQIDEQTRTIEETYDAVYDVTRTSAKDDTIAEIVTEMVVGTGYKGAINVETQVGVDTTAELVDGYLFNSGFVSKLFITDPKEKAAVLDNPLVLLINGRAEGLNQYADFLNAAVEEGHTNILLIGDEIDNELLNTLIYTRTQTAINPVFVRNVAGYDYLSDLAAILGATIYNPRATTKPPELNLAGTAAKAIVKEEETLIIGGVGELEAFLDTLDEETDAERISYLTGKIGNITVGGVTETQVKERKDRVDDAIGAARAALKGGIVPGAGAMLANITTGNKAVDAALKAPSRQLLFNAELPYTQPSLSVGTDVTSGARVNLWEQGIVDAAIITKDVVRNAFAVAGTFLTIGESINEKEYTQEQLDAMLKM